MWCATAFITVNSVVCLKNSNLLQRPSFWVCRTLPMIFVMLSGFTFIVLINGFFCCTVGGDRQGNRQAEFNSFMGEELSVVYGESDG